MKKLLSFVVALTLLSPLSAFTEGTDTIKPKVTELNFVPHKILVIGDSYMYYNCGITNYLGGMIKQKVGPKDHPRLAAVGRSNMSQVPVAEIINNSIQDSHHPKYGKLSDEMMDAEIKARETYDLVLFQASNRGEADQARDLVYGKAHAEAIRRQGATPGLIMPWTPKKPEAPAMEVVINGNTKIANENDMMVIPVGIAFMNAEKAHPDWVLIMPDKTHPTALGTYLAAATIYASVFKRDPMETVNFTGGCEKPIPEELRKEAAQIAWQTANQWFGWKK